MTPEERIAELENKHKAMTAEIEKLKVELAEKNEAEKNENVWIPETGDVYTCITSEGLIAKTTYYNNAMLDGIG